MKAARDDLVKHTHIMDLTENPYFFGKPRTNYFLSPWDGDVQRSDACSFGHLYEEGSPCPFCNFT